MSTTSRVAEPITPPWLTAAADDADPAGQAPAGPAPAPVGPEPGPPPAEPEEYTPALAVPVAAAEPIDPPAPAAPPPGTAPVPAPPGPGDGLTVHRPARRVPERGWRRWAHTVSAGLWNPGESAAAQARRALIERVDRPVRGDFKIALLSLKGGVGKTTTTIGLGSTFAALRGDRVIAVDANPDLGTLAQRVPRQTGSTARDLLADEAIDRYCDVRAHTSQAPSRLEVLASEADPAVSEAFDEHDYRAVLALLGRYYNIVLTDCGTGLMHSAMAGTLATADTLVLVTSPALDGVRSVLATIDWLEHHGYAALAARAVVVVNGVRGRGDGVAPDRLREVLGARCRAVHTVPYDRHLGEGAEVDLDLLRGRTRRAYLELAATVAEEFAAGPLTARDG